MILLACWFYTPTTKFPGATALAPVLGSALIILAGSAGGSAVTRHLGAKPFVFIGLISYSLYLWHWPLIVFTKYVTGEELSPTAAVVLAAVSLLLAWLSYRFVERPFRRKEAFSRRAVFASSGVAGFVLGTVFVVALAAKGYPDRFPQHVVALDQARSPEVPFKSCDGKPLANPGDCRFGTGKPTTLLWGDSHMLAWAPAFEKALAADESTAILAVASACPPIFEPRWLPHDDRCVQRANETRSFLNARPEVSTVILSARWGMYYEKAGEHAASVSTALSETVRTLNESGRRVVILGPVPTYTANVPLLLALQEVSGRQLLHSTASWQRNSNRLFYSVAGELSGAQFHDPVAWMCDP